MKALTANQQKIVDLMNQGWVLRSNQVYGNVSLFNPNAEPSSNNVMSLDNRVVGGLHLRGLLKILKSGFPTSTYELKEAA